MKSRAMKKTRQAWDDMRRRCSDPNRKDYPRYGGRGITYSPLWENFHCFLKDMGLAPTSKHSLDRIKNDLGYSKDNCRWATPRQQNGNRRMKSSTGYKNITKFGDGYRIEISFGKLKISKYVGTIELAISFRSFVESVVKEDDEHLTTGILWNRFKSTMSFQKYRRRVETKQEVSVTGKKTCD